MGKPAARMGDTTAHGGTITLGNPMVLIGKMPSAAMGDMHVCPMLTGPVPHVGGPITLGSTGVLIGKKPGSRISDVSVCVGPPSMPILGCMTVLIGEAGSGSQAGSAASAVAAAASRSSPPVGISPFPLGEPPATTENHYLECEVVDSAGRPLGGVKYKLTDPDNGEIVGVTSTEGRIYHSGYAKAGSFKVEVQGLSDAQWDKTAGKMGDTVKMSAKADGLADGLDASLAVFEETGHNEYLMVKLLPVKVKGGKLEGDYKLGDKDSGEIAPATGAKVQGYFFMAYAEGLVGVSKTLKISDTLELKLVDENGEAVKGMEYELTFADDTVKKGSLDASGKAQLSDLPSGPVKIKWKKKKS